MSSADGGPAFPTLETENLHPQFGMSLRDYFAARALPECLKWFGVKDEFDYHKKASDTAYRIADAMLVERAKAGAA